MTTPSTVRPTIIPVLGDPALSLTVGCAELVSPGAAALVGIPLGFRCPGPSPCSHSTLAVTVPRPVDSVPVGAPGIGESGLSVTDGVGVMAADEGPSSLMPVLIKGVTVGRPLPLLVLGVLIITMTLDVGLLPLPPLAHGVITPPDSVGSLSKVESLSLGMSWSSPLIVLFSEPQSHQMLPLPHGAGGMKGNPASSQLDHLFSSSQYVTQDASGL